MREHGRMTPDRLSRAREGRILGGVCAGLGRYTGIDPLVFRVGFALLVFASWFALPLYGVALLLMPAEGDEPAPLERMTGRLFTGATALTLLGVLLCAGVLLSLTGRGLINGLGGDALASLAIVLLIALTAQARGVDLVAAVRTLPDRLRGEPLPAVQARQAPPAAVPPQDLQAGWIDLATLRPFQPGPAAKEARVPSAPAEPSGATDLLGPADKTRPAPAGGCVERTGKRPPVLAGVTLLAASAAGASSLAFTSGLPEIASMQVALATALAVVALGLVAGTWAGGTGGLVAVGALLSVALIGSGTAADVRDGARFGDVSWRPVDPNATQPYRIVAGLGVLDLTALPLQDGGRYRVFAEVGIGGLRVVLPALAQVELRVSTGLGDVTVDKRITSGPRARVERTLPGVGANPPVLELHVKGRLGDLEVVRGQA
ncbi:PspC domain-containing protein [Actinocorallia populi]|uniref:PspC domain-containing protein n=1 Tax=Actinocorallia populi TaxID=2079200 RepID=UPI000D08A3CF|nr:PspC domain-containing protein [Actinocorallia populi]